MNNCLIIVLLITISVRCSSPQGEHGLNPEEVEIEFLELGLDSTISPEIGCVGNHFYFEFLIKNFSSKEITFRSTFNEDFCFENDKKPIIKLFLKGDKIKEYRRFRETYNSVPLRVMNLFEDTIVPVNGELKIKVAHAHWYGIGNKGILDKGIFLLNSSDKFVFDSLFIGQLEPVKVQIVQE